VKEAARTAAAEKEEQEQALKAAAAQRKQKYSSFRRSNGQKEAFKLSAVSLEDLFHELKRRNDSRSTALSCSSASTALSLPHENRLASASSSLSTASPRSLSPSSNGSAFDPLVAKEAMRPWHRDRASRDILRAKLRER